jgi:pilus assembly protein CpaE
VEATLDRLLAAPTGGGTAQGGRVAVVLGTRGGVGATTIAISLAWLVSEEMKKRTALLDLDLHFGTTALALDIDPGRGLRDALEKPERIDGLFIDRALAKVGTNLFTLAAEEPVEEGTSFDPEAAGTLLAELRQKFDWTVIDLPRGAGPLARTVLGTATDTIIVADSTLAGLRDTIRLQTLARMANPDQRVLVLKGGALGEHGGVSRGAFEKELGRPFDAAIPSDAKGAFAAANAGQPLPVAARNSPIVPAIRRLAATIAGVEPERKSKLGLRFGRL